MSKPTDSLDEEARTFEVSEFDAYSGWEPASVHTASGLTTLLTRREAWDACRQAAGPVQVFDRARARVVYEHGSVEQAEHDAWLGRCPR